MPVMLVTLMNKYLTLCVYNVDNCRTGALGTL